ncbi:MAG: hypothetical protein LBB04_03175 [Oscillospiraceae bacterium]|jgi:hypothetical protein|nr:hypothetical protein [Oscillospiraceae bacterium]
MIDKLRTFRVRAILLGIVVLSSLTMVQGEPLAKTSARQDMGDVENGTLVVGRWLIFLPKLTPEMLALAKNSAREADPNLPEESQTDQNDMFYKSDVVALDELAKSGGDGIRKDGTWYRINHLSDISDISTKGDPVSNTQMNQIYLTTHVKPDGVAYSLITEQPVDIFNLTNPYDLTLLPELENLKNKRGVWQSDSGVKEQRKEEIASIERVFAEVPKTAALNTELKKVTVQRESLEKEIADLEKASAELEAPANSEKIEELKKDVATKKAEELKMAGDVKKADEMGKADKDVEAFSKFRQYLVEQGASIDELNEVDRMCAGARDAQKLLILELVDKRVDAELSYAMAPKSEGDEENNKQYPDLVSEYETSKRNIKESRDKCEAAVSDGPDVISQTKKQKEAEVAQKAGEANSKARELVKEIVHLGNISSGMVLARQDESRVIDEMKVATLGKYSAALGAGASAEYKATKTGGGNLKILEGLKLADTANVKQLADDIYLLVEAKLLRFESDGDRVTYLDSIIAELNAARSRIVEDDFARELVAIAENLENRLLELRVQAQNRLDGGSQRDKLEKDLKILQTEYLKVLDSNDLVKAEQIKLKMDALSKKMRDSNKIGAFLENKEAIKVEEKKVEEGRKASAQLPALTAKAGALRDELPQAILDVVDDASGRSTLDDFFKTGDEKLLFGMDKEVLDTLGDKKKRSMIDDLFKIEAEIDFGEAKILEGQEAEDRLTSLKMDEKMLQSEMDFGTWSSLSDMNAEIEKTKELIEGATLVSDVTKVDEFVDAVANSVSVIGAAGVDATLKEVKDEIAAKVASSGGAVPAALNKTYDKINGMLDGKVSTTVENMQTESEIMQEVNNVLEGSRLLHDEEQAILILLFDRLEKRGDSTIYSSLKNQKLMEALKSGNILVISKFEQPNTDLYVPLENLAGYAKYDYVWELDGTSASLVKGKQVYKFKDGSNVVESADISKFDKEMKYEKEDMTEKAKFKSVMYVPRDYVCKTFEVDVKLIGNSNYAIMCRSNLEGTLEDLEKKLAANEAD